MSRKPEYGQVAAQAGASSETVLFLMATSVQAFGRLVGRRKAERYLRAWSEIVAEQLAVEALIPSRSKSERREQQAVKEAAAAWLREELPNLWAALPPE